MKNPAPIIFVIFLFLFLQIFTLPVLADSQKVISVTINPILVSLDVNTSSVTYGPVSMGDIDISPQGDPAILISQNGNVNEDFSIRGDNAVSTGTTWTLASTTGVSQYVHKYGATPAPEIPTGFGPLTTANNTFSANVAPGGGRNLKLKISTPSSTTTYSQFTTTVVLTAVQHL